MENKGLRGMFLCFIVYLLAASVYAAGGLTSGISIVAVGPVMLAAGFGGVMVESRTGVWGTYCPPNTIRELIPNVFLSSFFGLVFPIGMMVLKSVPDNAHSPSDIVFLETFSRNPYNLCDKVMIAAVLVAVICTVIAYREEN